MSQAIDAREAASLLQTLEQAFRWAIAQEPPFRPADVIVQDEFTHDVLFRATDGSR